MASAKVIDIDNEPQLMRLVDEIRKSHSPVRLRSDGEEVAVVIPLNENSDSSEVRKLETPDDLAEFLSIAGGWSDMDTDSLVEEIYRQRLVSTRSPFEL
jgi:hypothetical protein